MEAESHSPSLALSQFADVLSMLDERKIVMMNDTKLSLLNSFIDSLASSENFSIFPVFKNQWKLKCKCLEWLVWIMSRSKQGSKNKEIWRLLVKLLGTDSLRAVEDASCREFMDWQFTFKRLPLGSLMVAKLEEISSSEYSQDRSLWLDILFQLDCRIVHDASGITWPRMTFELLIKWQKCLLNLLDDSDSLEDIAVFHLSYLFLSSLIQYSRLVSSTGQMKKAYALLCESFLDHICRLSGIFYASVHRYLAMVQPLRQIKAALHDIFSVLLFHPDFVNEWEGKLKAIDLESTFTNPLALLNLSGSTCPSGSTILLFVHSFEDFIMKEPSARYPFTVFIIPIVMQAVLTSMDRSSMNQDDVVTKASLSQDSVVKLFFYLFSRHLAMYNASDIYQATWKNTFELSLFNLFKVVLHSRLRGLLMSEWSLTTKYLPASADQSVTSSGIMLRIYDILIDLLFSSVSSCLINASLTKKSMYRLFHLLYEFHYVPFHQTGLMDQVMAGLLSCSKDDLCSSYYVFDDTENWQVMQLALTILEKYSRLRQLPRLLSSISKAVLDFLDQMGDDLMLSNVCYVGLLASNWSLQLLDALRLELSDDQNDEIVTSLLGIFTILMKILSSEYSMFLKTSDNKVRVIAKPRMLNVDLSGSFFDFTIHFVLDCLATLSFESSSNTISLWQAESVEAVSDEISAPDHELERKITLALTDIFWPLFCLCQRKRNSIYVRVFEFFGNIEMRLINIIQSYGEQHLKIFFKKGKKHAKADSAQYALLRCRMLFHVLQKHQLCKAKFSLDAIPAIWKASKCDKTLLKGLTSTDDACMIQHFLLILHHLDLFITYAAPSSIMQFCKVFVHLIMSNTTYQHASYHFSSGNLRDIIITTTFHEISVLRDCFADLICAPTSNLSVLAKIHIIQLFPISYFTLAEWSNWWLWAKQLPHENMEDLCLLASKVVKEANSIEEFKAHLPFGILLSFLLELVQTPGMNKHDYLLWQTVDGILLACELAVLDDVRCLVREHWTHLFTVSVERQRFIVSLMYRYLYTLYIRKVSFADTESFVTAALTGLLSSRMDDHYLERKNYADARYVTDLYYILSLLNNNDTDESLFVPLLYFWKMLLLRLSTAGERNEQVHLYCASILNAAFQCLSASKKSSSAELKFLLDQYIVLRQHLLEESVYSAQSMNQIYTYFHQISQSLKLFFPEFMTLLQGLVFNLTAEVGENSIIRRSIHLSVLKSILSIPGDKEVFIGHEQSIIEVVQLCLGELASCENMIVQREMIADACRIIQCYGDIGGRASNITVSTTLALAERILLKLPSMTNAKPLSCVNKEFISSSAQRYLHQYLNSLLKTNYKISYSIIVLLISLLETWCRVLFQFIMVVGTEEDDMNVAYYGANLWQRLVHTLSIRRRKASKYLAFLMVTFVDHASAPIKEGMKERALLLEERRNKLRSTMSSGVFSLLSTFRSEEREWIHSVVNVHAKAYYKHDLYVEYQRKHQYRGKA